MGVVRCVRRGSCLLLPALKISVFVRWMVWSVGWLPGLGFLGEGMNVIAVVMTRCIVRFVPKEALVVRGSFGFFPLRCSGFGESLGLPVVFSRVEGKRVLEVWKVVNACLPPGHFCMTDWVCGVGANCIVHNW